MKDHNGCYYYPDLRDKKTRMYVRRGEAGIEFRLWQQDKPEIWERHPWLSREVVAHAAALYAGPTRSPLALYDMDVAARLLSDGD